MTEILLIYGNAGTGKSTYALSQLDNNPVVITKTRYLCKKFKKNGYRAATSASALGLRPTGPWYHLHPQYANRMLVPAVRKIIPRYEHLYDRKRHYHFEKGKYVSYASSTISSDFLFDDCGLLSEVDVAHWKEFFLQARIESKRIAFTFDTEQLNYGGLELVRWIKESSGKKVKEIVLTKEHRFEEQECRWHYFDKFKNIPVISSAEQAPKKSIFIAHSISYLAKARKTGGWSDRKSINIDKIQGREYDTIVVGLLGLAALFRNKIPGYKERIYTTITRGKKFIFYVPEGVPQPLINAAIRDVTNALSEVKRPIAPYDCSILNFKKSNSYMMSQARCRRLRHTVCATNRASCIQSYEEKKKRKESPRSSFDQCSFIIKRSGRFWPKKPRKTALARLFK